MNPSLRIAVPTSPTNEQSKHRPRPAWLLTVLNPFRRTVLSGPAPGVQCGRFFRGKLTHWCALAENEECEFECPHR